MIKSKTISFFGDKCKTCPQREQCLSPSKFNMSKRKFLIAIRGFKEKTNKYMIKGKQLHEKRQEDLLEMHQYGKNNFIKDILKGKKIILKEVAVCSSQLGIRGFIDILNIQFDLKKKIFNIEIKELKTRVSKGLFKKYLAQLFAYGWILSSPDCYIYYNKKYKRKEGYKKIPFKLYPQGNWVKNIKLSLQTLAYKKQYDYEFLINNRLSEQANNFCLYIQRLLKEKREIMKPGIYNLSDFKICEECKYYKCDFWERFCKYMPEKDIGKSKQRYLGKSKTVIKTKPKLTLNQIRKCKIK